MTQNLFKWTKVVVLCRIYTAQCETCGPTKQCAAAGRKIPSLNAGRKMVSHTNLLSLYGKIPSGIEWVENYWIGSHADQNHPFDIAPINKTLEPYGSTNVNKLLHEISQINCKWTLLEKSNIMVGQRLSKLLALARTAGHIVFIEVERLSIDPPKKMYPILCK